MVRHIAFVIVLLLASAACPGLLGSESFRTTHFVIKARDKATARAVAETSEAWLAFLSDQWFGAESPRWPYPAVVDIELLGPTFEGGGSTGFAYNSSGIEQITGKWVGSPQFLVDSVVPHEVMHLVTHSHTRRPVPRWLDEGISTSVEVKFSRSGERDRLIKYLTTGRGVKFNTIIPAMDYPSTMQATLPYYAQGHSMAEYLIYHGGKKKLGRMLQDRTSRSWANAVHRHYGFRDNSDFQASWLAWLKKDPRKPVQVIVNRPRLYLFQNRRWKPIQQLISNIRGGRTRGASRARQESGDT